jgi:ribose 5-phosphate isomerase B
MQKIVIGGDHRGYELKESIKKTFSENYQIIDVGTDSTKPVDYPDIAGAVCKRILAGDAKKGIIICGSGVGACVAANKFKGIRAGICHDVFFCAPGCRR